MVTKTASSMQQGTMQQGTQVDSGRAGHAPVESIQIDPAARRMLSERLGAAMRRHGTFGSDGDRLLFARRNIGLLWQCTADLCGGIERLDEVLVIRGLPASESTDDLEVSRLLCLMIVFSIGRGLSPCQFQQEKGGDLISTLITRREAAPADFANGLKRLPHHVDFAHSGNHNGRPDREGRPHFLVLGGVRNFGAETTYASIAQVMESVSTSDVRKLSRPDFVSTVSRETGLHGLDSGPMRVLWHTSDGIPAVTLHSSTRPLRDSDREGAAALARLRAALVGHEYSFTLDHGVYAVVSNLRGTHSRKEMPGAGSRVLLRGYAGALASLRARTHVFDMEQVFDYRKSPSD